MGTLDRATHEECLRLRLIALRADFGKDLGRLSGADRRRVDSTCDDIRALRGREAYLDCLSGQLVILQTRKSRGATPARSGLEAPAAALNDLPLASEMPVASVAPSSSASPFWLAGGVVTLAVAAAGLFLLKRTRHARRVCHKCGATDGVSGDLCSACRHEAAETLRRAAAERVGRERAEEAQKRQQRERDEEDRVKLAHNAEQERLRQQELARKSAETAQALEIEARRGHLASAEAARRGGSDEGSAFDPYAILGVAQGASPDDIRAAYEQAKAKYDLEQVADMGFEIKEHYKAKAQAVERAFQILTSAS